MSRAKIENKIHRFMGPLCKGVFSDAFWTPISNMAKHFKNEGIDLELLSAQYKGTGSDKRKEWHYEVREPSIEKGGWHLTVTASFGPSALDEKGENKTDRYDLNYVLSWDGRMKQSEPQSVSATLEAKAVSKNKLTESILDWLKEPTFMKAVPEMISAAKLAITVGTQHGNHEMIKFNELALKFLEAMHKKDENAATSAAQKLVDSGHGAAFGLEEGITAKVDNSKNMDRKDALRQILQNAGIRVQAGSVRLKDLANFVVANTSQSWSQEKLDAASKAIAKECMTMHKGASAWNPICAETLAKQLEHAMGYVNAVKISQVVETAWKENKRDLKSLSDAIKDALATFQKKLAR